MAIIDQPGKHEHHTDHSSPSTGGDQAKTQSPDELPDWLRTVGANPVHHHAVDVIQTPAPGHGNQIALLIAACTCDWRSGGSPGLSRSEHHMG